MDCGSNANSRPEIRTGLSSSRGVAESTAEDRILSRCEAAGLISGQGICLFLGYHPRANVGLGIGLCIERARDGLKCLVLDCDRTVALERERPLLSKEEAARVLVSHPEDAEALKADLKAAASIPDLGMILLNRASSLVAEFDPPERYRAKRKLWESVYPSLRIVSQRCPVVVLEDARRHDEVEYKLHPALFYLSDLILDAVDDGKNVQNYSIIKNKSPPAPDGPDQS